MKKSKCYRIWEIGIISFCLVLTAFAGCGKKTDVPESQPPESSTDEPESSMAESRSETQTEQTDTGESEDRLYGGGTGTINYEVNYEQKQYDADDGTAIFEVKLAYPVFSGETAGEKAINGYFDKWKNKKLEQYEADEDSTRQSALEVYRESKDVGWPGPWGEQYEVSSVKTFGGYVSVLLDSYLYEGGAHGMPFREGYVFRLSDGKEVALTDITGRPEEDLNDLLRARFSEQVEKGEEAMYYEDALDLIKQKDMKDTGYYFGDSGIVFYLPPYEIAPYSTGYVEITIPFEEAGVVKVEAEDSAVGSGEEQTQSTAG